MDYESAKAELIELRNKVAYHSYLYYVENRNEISDYEYDMLNNRIKDIEKQFPE